MRLIAMPPNDEEGSFTAKHQTEPDLSASQQIGAQSGMGTSWVDFIKL
jgi:hypothetical protein